MVTVTEFKLVAAVRRHEGGVMIGSVERFGEKVGVVEIDTKSPSVWTNQNRMRRVPVRYEI